MRSRVFLAGLLISGTLYSLLAAQPDTRFDGVWVGTETSGIHAAMSGAPSVTGGAGSGTASYMESVRQRLPAKIVIAEGGTMLGVLEGICPGRYVNVRKSGASIAFETGSCKLRVTLSGDGRTLTESGTAMGALWTGSGGVRYTKQVPIEVVGTFHREGR